MLFREARLAGAYEIVIELHADERGSFGRSYCVEEFAARGIQAPVIQCNVSYNRTRGTLRGMHYQQAPHEEAKLIRCTRGAIFDVMVDLRPESSTFLQWQGFELRASPGLPSSMVYLPAGFAHGFLTLEDDTEVFYQMSELYAPAAARGFRWNDPAIGIEWPEPVRVISERDRDYPDFVVPAVSR